MDITKIPTVDELVKGAETRFVLIGQILRDKGMTRAQWLELSEEDKTGMLTAQAERMVVALAERAGL